MLQSVLVPLDGTSAAAAAVPLARSIAEAANSSLTLLRVSEAHTASSVRDAECYLDSVARELRRYSTVHVDTVVTSGQPSREIPAQASQLGSELIVMSTRHVGQPSKRLDSIARWVLASTSVPIILLRGQYPAATGVRRILVPLDGTPGGALALGPAAMLAQAVGAQLELVYVTVPVPLTAYAALRGMPPGDGLTALWDQDPLVLARRYIRRITHRLQSCGLTVSGRVVTGTVTDQIIQVAHESRTDLIAMSTHAVQWPRQNQVGNVVDAVLNLCERAGAPGAA